MNLNSAALYRSAAFSRAESRHETNWALVLRHDDRNLYNQF